MVFVRPLLILAAGAAAVVAVWWVLMHEPGRAPGPVGMVREHLLVGDRLALDRVLRSRPDDTDAGR